MITAKPIEVTSDKVYAKNIWVHFMEKALEGTKAKNFKAAKGTIGVYINPENGKLATDDCPDSAVHLLCGWHRANGILYRSFNGEGFKERSRSFRGTSR